MPRGDQRHHALDDSRTLSGVDPGVRPVGDMDPEADRTLALSYTGARTRTVCREERPQVCDEIRLALAEVKLRTPMADLCGTRGGRCSGPSSMGPRRALLLLLLPPPYSNMLGTPPPLRWDPDGLPGGAPSGVRRDLSCSCGGKTEDSPCRSAWDPRGTTPRPIVHGTAAGAPPLPPPPPPPLPIQIC